MTLRQFAAAHDAGRLQIPAATAWYLAELAEGRGKQELFTRQSPQRLKALRESAIVESAISSNRIEGVEVAPARINTVVFGATRLRDRHEKEVRGYRKALAVIHERGAVLPAYKEFEARVGQTRSPRGAKTELVRAAIDRAAVPFRVADLQHACPGVGLDLIRRVLKQLQRDGLVQCLGRGPTATWRRTDESGSS